MQNSRNTINKRMTNTIMEDHYYNNNYNTQPGVSQEKTLSPEDQERIKEAYKENISDTITAAVAHMIENAVRSGLTVDEIIMAIEDTGFAQNPTPFYLRKILQTWAENGVTVSRIRHYVGANRALPWWK